MDDEPSAYIFNEEAPVTVTLPPTINWLERPAEETFNCGTVLLPVTVPPVKGK